MELVNYFAVPASHFFHLALREPGSQKYPKIKRGLVASRTEGVFDVWSDVSVNVSEQSFVHGKPSIPPKVLRAPRSVRVGKADECQARVQHSSRATDLSHSAGSKVVPDSFDSSPAILSLLETANWRYEMLARAAER